MILQWAYFPNQVYTVIYPQEIAQSVRTTPNETEITSSNLPPPLVWTCQKKKKVYIPSAHILIMFGCLCYHCCLLILRTTSYLKYKMNLYSVFNLIQLYRHRFLVSNYIF
jgi:hypothetical protein